MKALDSLFSKSLNATRSLQEGSYAIGRGVAQLPTEQVTPGGQCGQTATDQRLPQTLQASSH
jgi:hypothetical protein